MLNLLITKVVKLNNYFNFNNFNYILMFNFNNFINNNLISHILFLKPYLCFINLHTYLIHFNLINKDYNLASLVCSLWVKIWLLCRHYLSSGSRNGKVTILHVITDEGR